MITTKGPQGKLKIKVLRPFNYDGGVTEVDQELEVSVFEAKELEASHKAEIISQEKPAKKAVDPVDPEQGENAKKGDSKKK